MDMHGVPFVFKQKLVTEETCSKYHEQDTTVHRFWSCPQTPAVLG